MSRSWYVEQNGRAVGPVNSDQLKQLAASGKIGPNTRIRPEAGGDWHYAGRIKGLFPSNELVPAPKTLPLAPPPPVITVSTVDNRYLPAPQMECPFCAELIAENAKKCKHCGEFLDLALRAAADARQMQAPAQIFMNVAGGAANASASANATAKAQADFTKSCSGCAGCLIIIIIWGLAAAAMGAALAAR